MWVQGQRAATTAAKVHTYSEGLHSSHTSFTIYMLISNTFPVVFFSGLTVRSAHAQ